MTLRRTAMWLALCATAVLSGRCVITTSGSSSREMRKAILGSPLYRSSDIYYPDGLPTDPAKIHPDLGSAQLRVIRKDANTYLELVRAYYEQRVPVLSAYLGKPLARPLRTTVAIVNTGRPIAQAEPNGDVTIDVKVLQAIFRTSLLTGLGSGSMFSDDETEEQGEHARLNQFFEMKAKTRETKGRSRLGDIVGMIGDDELDGPWFQLADVMMTSEVVDRHYRGTLLFLLAHEVGHVALSHQAIRNATVAGCEGLQADELEADRFAAFLLADMFRALVAFSLFGEGESYVGFTDFFSHTYSLAEFTPGSVCTYPAVDARVANARAAMEAVSETTMEQLEREFARAAERAFDDKERP